MKTDKLLHLIQQKQPKSTGRFLPLPKAQQKGGWLEQYQGTKYSGETEEKQNPYVNDPYIGMRKFYDQAYEKLHKYAEKDKDGVLSNFDKGRAWLSAALKNPQLLFRERYTLTNPTGPLQPITQEEVFSTENNPYGKVPVMVEDFQGMKNAYQWPTDYVYPNEKDAERYTRYLEKKKAEQSKQPVAPITEVPEKVSSPRPVPTGRTQFESFTAKGYPMVDTDRNSPTFGKTITVPGGYVGGSKGEHEYREKQRGGSSGWLKKYQTQGEVQPIKVTDPNDPRLKAYNDSSYLHNESIIRANANAGKMKSILPYTDEDWNFFLSGREGHGHILKDFFKNKEQLKIKPVGFQNPENSSDLTYPYYKKPTTPYIYDPSIQKVPRLEPSTKISMDIIDDGRSKNVSMPIDRIMMPSGEEVSRSEFVKQYGEAAWQRATNQGRYKKQSGGPVVSEIWKSVTGLPWSEAKKQGLTDGSYEANIKLREQLLTGKVNIGKKPKPVAPILTSRSPLYNQALNEANQSFAATDKTKTAKTVKDYEKQSKVPVTKKIADKDVAKSGVRGAVQSFINNISLHNQYSPFGSSIATDIISSPIQAGLNIANTIAGDKPITGDNDLLNLVGDIIEVAPFAASAAPKVLNAATYLPRKAIHLGVDPVNYQISKKAKEFVPTLYKNIIDPKGRPFRVGKKYEEVMRPGTDPKFHPKTRDRMGKNLLDAWATGLGLPQKYNTLTRTGDNLYKINNFKREPELFKELLRQVNLNKRKSPNQLNVVEKSLDKDFTHSIYDVDELNALMGSYRWDVKKLPDGQYHFKAEDVFDLHPFKKPGKVYVDDVKNKTSWLRNKLENIEALGLVGGKPYTVKNNFIVDPKTFNVVKQWKQGGSKLPTHLPEAYKTGGSLLKAQTGNQGLYDSLLKYEEKADLENFAELLDPTGISSWDDAVKAYDQYKKSKDRLPSGSQMLDMFSATPGLGKLSYLRYLDPNGIKQLYKNFNWQKLLNTTDYFQDQYQNKDGGELHKFQARYSQVGIKPRTVTDLKNLLIYDQFDVENPILANRAGCVFDETGENCLASANRYFDKYVAPAAGIPNTWDLYEQLGVDQLKSLYNESIDSWDAHGVLQEKGATQLWAAKNENDWTNLSDEQKKQIYKKIPLGAFIGIGGVNPSHIAKDKGLAANKKRGLIPNRHSARVIGFTDDGIPLVYDYGKITPITKVLKDWPITNITVPTQYADYTYENVSKKYPRKTLDYNPDNTLKITSPAKGVSEGINQTEQLFIEGLNEAIPQLMQITGKSQQELNDYAKLAFGVLWNETSGGRSIVAAPKQFAATVREAFKGEPASKGVTRMKFTDLMNTPSFRTLADDLGINQLNFDLGSSSDPNDLKKQAAATLANLVRFKGDVPEGIDERYFRVQQHMAPYPSKRSIEYMKNFDRGYSNSAINAASRVTDKTGAGFPDLEAQIAEAEKRKPVQKQMSVPNPFATPKLQVGGHKTILKRVRILKSN